MARVASDTAPGRIIGHRPPGRVMLMLIHCSRRLNLVLCHATGDQVPPPYWSSVIGNEVPDYRLPTAVGTV
eukprot:3446458-Prymnesium_polylepis.1